MSGVVQLRPGDAMFDAMLRGRRAQQKPRGLKDETIDPRERQIRRFLDHADDQIDRAVKSQRKRALAANRDATLLKVIYGWGLRRTETSKLDVVDFGRNSKAPWFGRYGTLNVRYGKAKQGQPPRRRTQPSAV
ncbi:hypothetical protein [Streptomyces violaceusniger]|uniref:hypothetical protein n=1 Tax=Streptomyces violaceusniger TaxID=68280 RepID=UPI0036748A7E